jgi:hypothetical protein
MSNRAGLREEALRHLRAALSAEIEECTRRLEKARWYASETAPGTPNESANSYAQWRSLETELIDRIKELRTQLSWRR